MNDAYRPHLLNRTLRKLDHVLTFDLAGDQQDAIEANDRGHFMGYAAQVMRSIVVDFVRRRSADRRGGDAIHVDIDVAAAHITDPREREVIQIHEALQELEKIDPRLVKVVEMRYFAGMTVPEIAVVLGVPEWNVKRDWTLAKAWLRRRLKQAS